MPRVIRRRSDGQEVSAFHAAVAGGVAVIEVTGKPVTPEAVAASVDFTLLHVPPAIIAEHLAYLGIAHEVRSALAGRSTLFDADLDRVASAAADGDNVDPPIVLSLVDRVRAAEAVVEPGYPSRLALDTALKTAIDNVEVDALVTKAHAAQLLSELMDGLTDSGIFPEDW